MRRWGGRWTRSSRLAGWPAAAASDTLIHTHTSCVLLRSTMYNPRMIHLYAITRNNQSLIFWGGQSTSCCNYLINAAVPYDHIPLLFVCTIALGSGGGPPLCKRFTRIPLISSTRGGPVVVFIWPTVFYRRRTASSLNELDPKKFY